MTQQVRKGYRNHRKASWAGVLLVLVAAALAIVLPALGQSTDSNTGVAPQSGQGVYPSTANVGGSNFACRKAGATAYPSAAPTPTLTPPLEMKQFQISKPTPGKYTDPATNVTFEVFAPSAGKDPKSYFSFKVLGGAAVVYHVGVNGGTKTAWYDYYDNTLNSPGIGGDGVSADTDLHSTPDSKYAPTPPSSNTFFTASITTFCFVPLTVKPTCTSPFSGTAFGGTANYSAQLVSPTGLEAGCKQSDVVMYSYTPGTNQLFATLNPVSEAPGQVKYKVVERIYWTGITGDSQNPVTLQYDDTYPYDGQNTDANNIGGGANDGWRVMKFCASDPRPYPNNALDDPNGNTPFDLTTAPTMPAPDAQDGPHSSCMLQSTDSAGSGTSGRTFDAWIYSLVDGARGFG